VKISTSIIHQEITSINIQIECKIKYIYLDTMYHMYVNIALFVISAISLLILIMISGCAGRWKEHVKTRCV